MHNQRTGREWLGVLRTEMTQPSYVDVLKEGQDNWENCSSLPHAKGWTLFFPGTEEHDTINLLGSFQKNIWHAGAGIGETHHAFLNWRFCPALAYTETLQAAFRLGPWWDSMADMQGTHRHYLDPSYGFAFCTLHLGFLKDRNTGICSVSVWVGCLLLPGSLRRVFEMEVLVEREPLSCLDPGLFLSHPDNLPHLYRCKLSTSERLTHPRVVYLLANCSGINQLVFQSRTDADKKLCNVKTNTKGEGTI